MFAFQGVALAACSLLAGCAPEPPPPRGVVLLCLDTLRADHLGSYGYARDTSPEIDELAAESVVFERAVAQSASTLPSHRSLFQSRLASRATPDGRALAEVLREAGFRTAAFTGGGNMSAAFGFARGFEVYDEDRAGLSASLPRAEAWLREYARERFFLFLHTYDIHLPYDPPPPFDAMFGEAYDGPVSGSTTRPLLRSRRGLDAVEPGGVEPLDAEDRARVVALYDGGVRYTDGWVGRLRELLVQLEIADTTLLVLYSDHGEEFREHGSWLHSHTVFDELVRVPLIWHAPGLPPGRVASQVRLLDLAPSLLEVLGVGVPASFEGRSLAPLLGGGRDEHRPAISEMYRLKSLVVWPWKLIRGGSEQVLFDLAADAAEQRDLAKREPDRVAELSMALELAVAARPGAESSVEELDDLGGGEIDAELEQRLRELGYLD